MTELNIDEPESQETPPRKSGRIALIVAGVLVVALGVTAAVVVPRVLQSQRVEEYTALAEELRVVNKDRAQVETTLHAATALTYVRHGEALSVANAVTALGESKEPMLPASQAELLGAAGTAATEEIGPLEEGAAPEDGSHELLTLAFVEAKAAEEQARAEAEEAGEAVPEVTLADSLAELTVDQAIALLAAPVAPEVLTTVPDEGVTDEAIEDLRQSIATVQDEIAVAQEAASAETDRHDFLTETVASMVPVLQETAAAIDDYLAAVEEEAAKAEEDVASHTTAAAERIREHADSEDAVQLQGRIASYVVAGEASLVSHAEVVKAEEEAAEAKRLEGERAAQRRSSSNSGSVQQMCTRIVPNWFGGGSSLILVPCRY